LTGAFAAVPCALFVFIAAGLLIKSIPLLETVSPAKLFFSSAWKPLQGEFGFLAFIAGTLWVTLLSILIAVPPSLMCAVYLSEYAARGIRNAASVLLDLLAAIPSVVYGLWGVLVIVPLVRNFAAYFSVRTPGYCVLSASLVLACMVVPVITHISLEVLKSIPADIREASLSLGATRWKTIKSVVLRKAYPGIAAAVILGISRAFGETMAVLMTAGNVIKVPGSIFEPAYPLPALLANNFGEMLSVPMYESALLFSAFVLLAIVTIFNVTSRIYLTRVHRSLHA